MMITAKTLIREEYIIGDEALELERQMACLMGAAGCVLVEKAREGLAMTLKACGLSHGDGVFCTALGDAATVTAIEAAGAVPFFVDINPNTLNIDPYCLEYAINKCGREKITLPKAVIAADIFGMPCNYGDISAICDKYGIFLIEDMGGAFGARHGEYDAGKKGRFTILSFYQSTPAGLVEEGAVLCRDTADLEVLHELRGDGAQQQSLNGEWGSGNRAQPILIAEMVKRFDVELARRKMIAEWYKKRLEGHVRMQQSGRENVESAFTQFVIMLENEQQRMAVMDKLTAERISCAVFYPTPLHQRMKKGDWHRVMLVNAQRASQRLLALPMHPYLSENVVDYICRCVIETLETKLQ